MDKDTQLIDELYDKLTWFTFQTGEDDFDKNQVTEILELLDKIDPLDPPNDIYNFEDHLLPFPEEFCIDPADARRKLGLDGIYKKGERNIFLSNPLASESINVYSKKHKFNTTPIKVAATTLLVLGISAFLSLNSIADRRKSFFEILMNGANSMRITVTGNEEDEHKSYYTSWDVLKYQAPSLLVPEYIPPHLQLQELYVQKNDYYQLYCAAYSDKLIIKIYSLQDGFVSPENGWELSSADGNILIFKQQKNYLAILVDNGYIYTIEWNKLDEIKKIMNSMHQ